MIPNFSFSQFLKEWQIPFEENLSLSKKTWIKTGGTCDYWVVPDSVQQLIELCRFLYANDLQFDIVGQTSNIFFHSSYNAKIVVSTVKVNHYDIKDGIITCDCGVNVAKLSRECLEAGYKGFCGLVGLPGTIAASVYGNAGCFDCSISSMLINIDVLTLDGQIKTYSKEELGFRHRSSAFKRKEIKGLILTVRLKAEVAEDIEAEKKKAEESTNYRKTKQEKPNWCLGSVYSSLSTRNNTKNKVARIITTIAEKLHLSSARKAMKRSLLFLYGYRDLNPYVSDRNVNTFIWRDEKAEQKFERYKEFMGKVYSNLLIEVEEKSSTNGSRKIGILTYHRAENYGALLQAYGMRTFLQQQGFDASFVDYWPNYHDSYFNIFSLNKFKRSGVKAKIQYLFETVVFYGLKRRRKRNLQSFMKNQLGLPEEIKYSSNKAVCNEFDVVVYGSDQIWRKQNLPGCKGYDFWYFGSDNVTAKKISYAGSMGTINTTPEEDEQLKPYFERFAALAVREAPLKDYLAKMGLNSTVVLDPVFLLDKEDWRKMYSSSKSAVRQKGKYILYYNLLSNAESTAFANQFSDKTGLPIIEISKKYEIKQLGARYNHTASVQEFLSLIDHAEYVVSNSFHGVAFSIIFEKQFYAIGMGARANRVQSLLSALEISDRYVDNKVVNACIDYDKVGERIELLRKQSVDYLKNAL